MKRLVITLTVMVLLIASAAVYLGSGVPEDGPYPVLKVVDGDTIVIQYRGREEKVRLLRIDTPEYGQRGHREATEALRGLVGGKKVRIEFEYPPPDVRDQWNRLLCYVYVDDMNVNIEMVRLGWTRFWIKYGKGPYGLEFTQAEQEARDAGRGMWPKKGIGKTAKTP